MLSPAGPARAALPCRIHGRGMMVVPEVDDDQFAALRRLRVACGPIELPKSFAITQSLAMTQRMIRVGAQVVWRGGEDGGPAADDP
jgi:hypothetical protein